MTHFTKGRLQSGMHMYFVNAVSLYGLVSSKCACNAKTDQPAHLRNLSPGLEVIKHVYSLKLKIKRNDWLFADTCPQAANHCTLF